MTIASQTLPRPSLTITNYTLNTPQNHNAAETSKESLASSIDKLRGTEAILPVPTPSLPLPTINSPAFRKHGDAILVVNPTTNKQKADPFTEAFNALKPFNVKIHYVSAPSESDVGEQPYDEAGVEDLLNRIPNAWRELSESTLEEKKLVLDSQLSPSLKKLPRRG
ncbi:hypothetical protein DL765_011133 [Monosporascus sp. GIB2]|nr:hypothetical protein DL765_011133 [Monosporascus sp. GIB2]